MALQPNIILSGRSPNYLNTLANAAGAAGAVNQVSRGNALARLYRQQGPQIMKGDQQALNALARFDPTQALGIAQERRKVEYTQAQIDALRAKAAADTKKYAANLDEEERKRQAEMVKKGLAGLAFYYQQGDREGYERFAAENGIDTSRYRFEDLPANIAALEGAYDVLENFSPKKKPSAAEAKIARIMETGVDRETAILIADGVIKVSTDPVTKQVKLIDARTGREWKSGEPAVPREVNIQEPAVSPAGDIQQGFVPDEIRPPRVDDNQGIQAADPDKVLQSMDVEGALGGEGMINNIANTIADAVNLGRPSPAADRAAQFINNLSVATMLVFSGEWSGKPSNLTREKIEEMTVKPNSIFMGGQRARDRFQQMQDLIATAIMGASEVLESTEGFTPDQKAEAQMKLNQLVPLWERYEAIINKLQSEAPKVQWRIVE